jgi:hypothetical protein
MWNEERAKLENELESLKKSDQQINGSGGHPVAVAEVASQAMPIRTINYRVTRMSNEPSGIPELKQKVAGLEKRVAKRSLSVEAKEAFRMHNWRMKCSRCGCAIPTGRRSTPRVSRPGSTIRTISRTRVDRKRRFSLKRPHLGT